MALQFNLNKALDELGVTAHYIAVETKNRPASVLSLAKGEMKRLDLEMLDNILDELNMVAIEKGINREYTIEDVISYVNPN